MLSLSIRIAAGSLRSRYFGSGWSVGISFRAAPPCDEPRPLRIETVSIALGSPERIERNVHGNRLHALIDPAVLRPCRDRNAYRDGAVDGKRGPLSEPSLAWFYRTVRSRTRPTAQAGARPPQEGVSATDARPRGRRERGGWAGYAERGGRDPASSAEEESASRPRSIEPCLW
jgi:hypothetical protein